MSDYLKENIDIRKEVELISKKRSYGCVSVREVAKKLKKDPRTINAHLQIMENYDFGLFVDEKKTLFCTKEGLRKISEKVKQG
jgi:DNA-binding transcriptional regulator YhcF (GntR family)|tara:strand:- start:68 stop:316 length:249 start_codon:yes stop_codon:yes gene_type:complete